MYIIYKSKLKTRVRIVDSDDYISSWFSFDWSIFSKHSFYASIEYIEFMPIDKW